jgi:hypothetical protein
VDGAHIIRGTVGGDRAAVDGDVPQAAVG